MYKWMYFFFCIILMFIAIYNLSYRKDIIVIWLPFSTSILSGIISILFFRIEILRKEINVLRKIITKTEILYT